MKDIDWKKVAEDHGLDHKQFIKQLMIAATCAAAVQIDKQYNAEAFRFFCEDDVSELELVVRRTGERK